MGRINKNGFISGSVGNLVFVNTGDRNIVRSKPDTVKQSANTRRAAGVFGYVSRQDAIYRRKMMQLCGLTADDRYAYRHRALMYRMAVRSTENGTETVSLLAGNPKIMENFGFNRHTEWQNVCRFFPEINLDASSGTVTIAVPELKWNRELKPPKKMNSAKLRLICIAALPDESQKHNVQLLNEFTVEATPGKQVQKNIFSVNDVPEGQLVFVLAEIQFQQPGTQNASPLNRTASTYLWGGKRKNRKNLYTADDRNIPLRNN